MATSLKEIEEIFHLAMEVRLDERSGYLDRACSDDDRLRREVDSLISAYESDSGLLDEGAVTLAMRVLGSTNADLMTGKEVGPYKILNLLGQGGMGAVYLAENRRVNKKVALKFLSAEFFEDNWGKRQLIKEAQAVAMLDHPNICAVYDFEEIDNHSFIVMQYIEGQTLADLIREKSLKQEQFVPLSQQIGTALAAAHAHGIIHRDIKPKNIMVTPSGQVKVLDFGLAKTMQKSLEETESISQLSRDGLLIGTVAYMSPEQLRGEKLDYRGDIFSLGTVLYEMICGKNPFAHRVASKSKSNAEVISAIMAEEPPPLRQVALNCPKGFDYIVGKCLKKDRAERYQSAAELLIDLDDVQKGVAFTPQVNPYVNVRVAALAAMVLLAIVVTVFVYLAWGSSRQTLAVLPITCDEATVKTQCLGPALTEGLVNTLGRRNGLRISPSQTVTLSFFGPEASSPQKVGREMNADIVMFGKISRGEKGLMLTWRMERVKDGVKIAEESQLVNPDKLPVLAQWISLNTAMLLKLPMNDEDKVLLSALAPQHNQSPEAVELYVRGRDVWHTRDGENILRAVDYFEQATKKDPMFAKAYAGLADCYVEMTTVRYRALGVTDAMFKAEWAAKRAVSLDDNLAEAHSAYAMVLMKARWDWENAEKEFKRAIALSPDYSPAHLGYSSLLRFNGRMVEALAESKTAMNLEPFSGPAILNHCKAKYFARQFDQADVCLSDLAKEQPDFENGKYMHGIVYIAQGRIQEATQVFERIYANKRVLGGAMLGFVYGISNRRADAQRVLAEMRALPAKDNIPPQEFAIIYFGLDDLDQAFPLLRKATEEKFPSTQAVFIDPMYDRYRSDPRFVQLAREAKLPLRPLDSSAALNVSAK